MDKGAVVVSGLSRTRRAVLELQGRKLESVQGQPAYNQVRQQLGLSQVHSWGFRRLVVDFFVIDAKRVARRKARPRRWSVHGQSPLRMSMMNSNYTTLQARFLDFYLHFDVIRFSVSYCNARGAR